MQWLLRSADGRSVRRSRLRLTILSVESSLDASQSDYFAEKSRHPRNRGALFDARDFMLDLLDVVSMAREQVGPGLRLVAQSMVRVNLAKVRLDWQAAFALDASSQSQCLQQRQRPPSSLQPAPS